MARLALGLLLATTACSGGTNAVGAGPRLFSPDWQNDGGRSIALVEKRVSSAPLPEGVPVAVGVTDRGLVGVLLEGGGKWSYATQLDARPVITGEVVVGSGAGKLFALDARSGKALWSIPSAGALRGAGDDGSITVATVEKPSGGVSAIIAVARDGKKLFDSEPGVEVGDPAVRGGVAFIPWGSQYVSALDVSTGKEVGRWLSQSQVSQAINIGGAIYFGQAALTRLDPRIADAMPPKVGLPARELPGEPVWHDDGTDQTPPAATARDQIRAYARPTPATPPGIDSDRFVVTYFRIVMGLHAEDASLRWVRSFDHNVLGGAAARGGFALCDASGKVTLLDEAGGTAGDAALGKEVTACVVQAGTLQIPDGKPLPPLPEQITQAIQVKDAQMAAAQRFLLLELGKVEAPIATKALIDVASNPRTPAELLNDARRLLAQRRNGAEHMLEALKRHYDFLGDILRPPPVGPLADALSAMNEQRAAPLLAEHLNDPANSVDDVERTARALAKLATAAQADDLKTFFALYRATADQTELVNAVVFAAEALLRIGGEEGRRIVERAVEDPLTHPQVKSGLASLMPASNRAGSR